MTDRIIETLEEYNRSDLAKKVSALQLTPSNQHHSTRLDVLTYAIYCLSDENKEDRISNDELVTIFNMEEMQGYSSYEDPCENFFTEPITFFGGNYLVFPGVLSEAVHILTEINTAIFFSPEFANTDAFRQEAYNHNQIVLSITNDIANKLDYSRYHEVPNFSENLSIPNNFSEVQSVTTYTKEELEELIQPIPISFLASYLTTLGSVDPNSFTVESSQVFLKPILQVNDEYIIAQPTIFLAALRHNLLIIAQNHDQIENLGSQYLEAVSFGVHDSFLLQNFRPLNIQIPEEESDVLSLETFWSIDTNKIAFSIILSDSFREYDEDEIFGPAFIGEIEDQLEKRLKTVEEFIFENFEQCEEIFFVIVLSTVGRPFGFALKIKNLKRPYTLLTLTVFELHVISILETGRNLALYNFSKALHIWRSRVSVMAWSTLTYYEIYRKDEGFYISDNALPNFISLGSDFGTETMVEAIKKIDKHGVPGHGGTGYGQVQNIHRIPEVPIYFPMRSWINKRSAELFLEIEPPFWIVVKREMLEPNVLKEGHPNVALLLDMVSYWLWQFKDDIEPLLKSVSQKAPTKLVIGVDLRSDWNIKDAEMSLANNPVPLTIEIHEEDDTIEVTFLAGLVNVISEPNNNGELNCMLEILEAITNYLLMIPTEDQAQFRSTKLTPIIEKHKENKQKKKLLAFDVAYNPKLLKTGTSYYRKVVGANRSAISDEIGRYIVEDLRLEAG